MGSHSSGKPSYYSAKHENPKLSEGARAEPKSGLFSRKLLRGKFMA